MPNRNKNLTHKAIILRKNMTKQEKHLWHDFLKKHPIRFYRQRIIGNYIADFYCSSAKLVVELDGSQHYEQDSIEYDNLRTAYFNTLNIHVIRFANSDCDNNFESICMAIDKEIKERM